MFNIPDRLHARTRLRGDMCYCGGGGGAYKYIYINNETSAVAIAG